ncbi:unnamed protein product [Caenorhabditis angaria]|uniref:Uncharacterized protein n=1 Tax=Caenorhabditis angaria TaxID=860376 RepID=A0A9P1INQ6_9PELO|nr:unnamed protein product [Caenorhabditis angaria]
MTTSAQPREEARKRARRSRETPIPTAVTELLTRQQLTILQDDDLSSDEKIHRDDNTRGAGIGTARKDECATSPQGFKCHYCGQNHQSSECRNMPLEERRDLIDRQRRCVKCLRDDCRGAPSRCRARGCKGCGDGTHHTSLLSFRK